MTGMLIMTDAKILIVGKNFDARDKLRKAFEGILEADYATYWENICGKQYDAIIVFGYYDWAHDHLNDYDLYEKCKVQMESLASRLTVGGELHFA